MGGPGRRPAVARWRRRPSPCPGCRRTLLARIIAKPYLGHVEARRPGTSPKAKDDGIREVAKPTDHHRHSLCSR